MLFNTYHILVKTKRPGHLSIRVFKYVGKTILLETEQLLSATYLLRRTHVTDVVSKGQRTIALQHIGLLVGDLVLAGKAEVAIVTVKDVKHTKLQETHITLEHQQG